MIIKARRLINPPYSKADFLIIIGTLLVLPIIPVVLMVSGRNDITEQARAIRPSEERVVEDQTLSLLDLNSGLEEADNAKKKIIINKMDSLVEDRKEILSKLAEENPAEVLKVSYPEEIKKDFPKQIQDDLEKEVSIQGTLEVLHIDDFSDNGDLVYFLKTKKETYTLHSEEEIADFPSGTNVKVSGVAVGDKIVLDKPIKKDKVLAAVDTTGNQRNAVILVNFQNDTSQRFTKQTANNIMFTNSNSVNKYYQEASYSKASITGDVFGWYTLPINKTCNYTTVLNQAVAASDADINFQNYSGIVIAMPASCGWAGLAYVGKINVATADGTVRTRVAWIRDASFNLRVIAHEIGHGFGVSHANAYECGSLAIGTSCSSVAYGDPYDIMGSSGSGHFNSYYKERFAWFDSADIKVITTSGDYVIEPYQTNTTNPKVLKVPRDLDSQGNPINWLYVEWRQQFGFDSGLSGDVYDGALVRYARKYSNTGDSQLLDITPQTSSRTDGSLTVGRTLQDLDAGVTIRATNKTTSTLGIRVDIGVTPCTRANPTVSISPTQDWGGAGATLSYTISVKNNDSVGCGTSTFSLTNQVPAGWTYTLGFNQLSLSPSTTGTSTWNVTSVVGAADGFYNISATATNQAETSYKGQKTATYVVSGDIQDPIVVITNPTANATVSGTITVTAEASDNVGVEKVQFKVGPELRQTDTTAPYTYEWDTTKDTDNRYTLVAIVTDTSGRVSNTSQFVTVANNPSDTQKPTAPTNLRGRVVSSTRIDLAWGAATDNVGVVGYRIYRNNSLIKRISGRTYADKSVKSGKTYTYYVRAYDAGRNISAGSNLIRVTTPGSGAPKKLGDINGDGSINIFDLSIILSRWNSISKSSDLNGSGRVDIFDLSILLSRWGR